MVYPIVAKNSLSVGKVPKIIGVEHDTNPTRTCWFGFSVGNVPGGTFAAAGIGIPPLWLGIGFTAERLSLGLLALV